MKSFLVALATLAPLAAVACTSQETKTEVADARSVTLVVSGMT